jgi:hypothetical protein
MVLNGIKLLSILILWCENEFVVLCSQFGLTFYSIFFVFIFVISFKATVACYCEEKNNNTITTTAAKSVVESQRKVKAAVMLEREKIE